jgi:TatD DNase family protein
VISLIDTHAHLDLPEFDADRDEMLRRSLGAGVHAIVLIGFDPARWRSTARMCARTPYLLRTVGVHPNRAEIWDGAVARELRDELDTGEPVAVGEIGIDLFRQRTALETQRRAFAEQLEIAADLDLPVVIHQRDAQDMTLDILEDGRVGRGVMHCFSGDTAYARRCLQIGFYLGVGGVLSFPKSAAIRDAIAFAPLDRIILETDAPYLAPQSQRGARNEPAYLQDVLELLARLHDRPVAEVAEMTSRAAIELFGSRLATARHAGREHARCA